MGKKENEAFGLLVKVSGGRMLMTEYDLGDVCYLVTDVAQEERMVTGMVIRGTGVIYILVCGMDESSHQGFEISRDRDVMKASGL